MSVQSQRFAEKLARRTFQETLAQSIDKWLIQWEGEPVAKKDDKKNDVEAVLTIQFPISDLDEFKTALEQISGFATIEGQIRIETTCDVSEFL